MADAFIDAGIKLAALEEPGRPGGETVGGKDDAPAAKPGAAPWACRHARAKAEKCLTEAVYFEARGEPLRGQEAVAQVVMNRVFSGYYPNNVCGVVFQNASHYLACQFTFACEHKDLSRIDEPDMWVQAKRIAKDTLDGKIWLADIGHATHYHAYWVHPSWVHEMTQALQTRRAHVLSTACLGQRRLRAGLGPGAAHVEAADNPKPRRRRSRRRSDREAVRPTSSGGSQRSPILILTCVSEAVPRSRFAAPGK